MTPMPVSPFLRRALLADAAASGATGLLMLLGADFLKNLFGLPTMLMQIAGLSLLPFVAFLLYLSTRTHLSPRPIWGVIVCNALWTIDSLLLLSGWLRPTMLGSAFIIAQAAVVAAFAVMQYFGLRRSESIITSTQQAG